MHVFAPCVIYMHVFAPYVIYMHCMTLLDNIVGMSVTESMDTTPFGAASLKTKKGMFRTVSQTYKVRYSCLNVVVIYL